MAVVVSPSHGNESKLVEPDPGEQAVEQTARRVVHLRPDEADDDRRDGVREERDHPVEAGAAQPAHPSVRRPAHGDHGGEREAQHHGDQRDDHRELDVVQHRRHEDVVVDQLLVVVEPDEVHVGREARPVGHRVPDRLHERPHHDEQEQRHGQPEEHEEEADPVKGQRTPRPPARWWCGRGVREGDQRGSGHVTSIFLIESSSRTLSVISCSPEVSSETLESPARKLFQTTSWSTFMP